MPERFIVDRDLADEGEEAAWVIPHAAPWRPTDSFHCAHTYTLPVLGTAASNDPAGPWRPILECVRCRHRFAEDDPEATGAAAAFPWVYPVYP